MKCIIIDILKQLFKCVLYENIVYISKLKYKIMCITYKYLNNYFNII